MQFHLEPQVIYYRKDIFEKAGFKVPLKDLNEFVEAAKAVTDPAKNMWGFGQAYSDCPDGNNAFMMFMWAFGGMLQNKNNELVVNSPETLQGLTYYADLYTKHKVVPTGATGWDDTGNNKAYLSGQAAMILNTGSVIYSMRTDNKEMLANTVLGPLPAGPAGPQAFTGGSTVGIFQSSKHQDQCRQVIRTILSPERYPGNLKAAGGMFFPSLKKYESDPFFVEDRWNKEIAGTGQYAKQGHYAGDPQPWIGELGLQWLWSKMTTKVVVGGATPKAALDEFTQKCKEIQKKYEGL